MSTSSPAHLRRSRLIITTASTAVLVAVTAIGFRQAKVEITPGTGVLSVQASEIEGLTYLSGEVVLKARRTAPSGPFDIVAGHDGRLVNCKSSRDLAGLLPQLANVTAQRQLTLQQAEVEFPVKLGMLQLEDRIMAEPMPRFTVRTRNDRSRIVLIYDKVAVETNTAPEVFTKLGAGCAALALK